MTPTEKYNRNKDLMIRVKKADFLTIVCICCVIADKESKKEPFVWVPYEINNN